MALEVVERGGGKDLLVGRNWVGVKKKDALEGVGLVG